MTVIGKNVLSQIRTANLRPKPRWFFQLRESGLWLILVLALVTIALMISLFWFFASETDLSLMMWLTGRPFFYGRGPGTLLLVIFFVAIFLVWNFRNTRRGYRYNLGLIALIFICISAALAGIFGYLNFNKRLDHGLMNMPFYESRQQYMIAVWQQPSEGRITGEIVAASGSSSFVLRDFSGVKWQVSSAMAVWRHNMVPEIGLQVKIIGSDQGGGNFLASYIRPFMPMMDGCGLGNKSFGQGSCGMMN
ncbi:MAG: hypothetical protein WCG01_04410 [bacterium]